MHPDKKVVQKCTFCMHRLDKGLEPSCVNTCPPRARIFGDLNDPDSKVSKLLFKNAVSVLRPEMKTGAHVFYIGLDGQVAEAIKKPRRKSA